MSTFIHDLIARLTEAEVVLRSLAAEPDVAPIEVERLSNKADFVRTTITRMTNDELHMGKGKTELEDALIHLSVLMNIRKDVITDSHNSVGGLLQGQKLVLELIRQTIHSIVD